MRAARFYDRGDIRIDEINEPIVKAGQVGIDVAWCGICGTDLHEFLDGPPMSLMSLRSTAQLFQKFSSAGTLTWFNFI